MKSSGKREEEKLEVFSARKPCKRLDGGGEAETSRAFILPFGLHLDLMPA
jgi:hypothetical protein